MRSPKRDELSFRAVLALPKASRTVERGGGGRGAGEGWGERGAKGGNRMVYSAQ